MGSLADRVFLQLIEANRVADVALFKKGKIALFAGRCNSQVAAGANGIVEPIATEPVREVGLFLGEHGKPPLK